MVRCTCACGREIELAEQHLGQPIRCPQCGSFLRAIGAGQIDKFTARLIIELGPNRIGEQLILGGDGVIDIGKSSGQIQLNSPRVSRKHAHLSRTPTGWKIEDLNSTNGVYINGERASSRELHAGDVIHLGDYALRFADIAPI
jgi:pSer/pThr/pTyr-binding forkhead associated (FHA) protein